MDQKEYLRREAAKHRGLSVKSYDGGSVPAIKDAQFTITVTRVGETIDAPLPAPLFMAQLAKSAFLPAINSYLPTGITVEEFQNGTAFLPVGAATVGTLADANAVSIQFTDGVNSDLVQITSDTVFYPQFLAAGFSLRFKTTFMKVQVSELASATAQFQLPFHTYKNTIFGASSANPINLGSFKSRDQQQDQITDVPIPFYITENNGMWTNILASDGLSVTYTFWVSYIAEQGNPLMSNASVGGLNT